jgi:hypothetical protein
MALLTHVEYCMPLTVSRALDGREREASYTTSMAAMYLDYARFEAELLDSPLARRASLALLRAFAPLLRHLDPVVILDNAPVSTYLRTPRPYGVWDAAVRAVRQQWPGHAIVVRSLDMFRGGSELHKLERLGLQRVLSRRVFFQDPQDDWLWKRRNVRTDGALRKTGPAVLWRALVSTDAAEVARLYWALYGERYSALNPRFSAEWIAYALETGGLQGEMGLSEDGQPLCAFAGLVAGGLITYSIFGYDTALPADLGLYRRMSYRSLEYARERRFGTHASAGAGAFKLSRGGIPADEFLAVSTEGCPAPQQRAWRLLRLLSRSVGGALLEMAD